MKMQRLKRKSVRCIQGGIFVMGVLVMSTWRYLNPITLDKMPDISPVHASSRHLMSLLPNCTPRAIEQFPRDLFTADQRYEGAIIIHVLVAFYMFLGFALLCDDYFVPSLEVLCNVLKIQPDVAGATFMAAGSSAPELATAVIAVFIAKDDIGIGTVVGSAVYNIMFVISICALCAGMVINLNWWPLVRDCVFYTLSVTALAIVILDEKVFWYEALSFIVLYLVYILLMYFNESLEAWIVPKFSCCTNRNLSMLKKGESIPLVIMETDKHGEYIVNVQSHGKGATTQSNGIEVGNIQSNGNEVNNIQSNGSLNNGKETSFISRGAWDEDFDSDFEDDEADTSSPLMNAQENHQVEQKEQKETPESVFQFPDVWWKKIIWFCSIPLKCLFYISIPDCRLPRWRLWFVVTFIMSLVWLSVLSYLMVWMITIIGFTAGIADTIMGLTFIAFGVSLPDVISSLIVVREGLGDMAVSNAVGSNVFDILICLGVPWLIKTFINFGEPVQVYSGGLLYATLTLLITVLFLLVSVHINGWRLTKKYGILLMVVYVLFTVLTSLYELNIFGYVHPAECISTF